MQFSQFPLDPRLIRGLNVAQYIDCTPVQEATLKAVIEAQKDVYAQSQTGTGKTAAFLIATFWHLLKEENKEKFALILAPTRELVVQIEKEAKMLGQFLDFVVAAVYGGTAYDKQIAHLKRNPRIVIATPGRLIDFANQKALHLKHVGVMVIDEVDRLFDMGFQQDILKIIKMLPPAQQRLNLLFSATLNNKVGQLAWEHMNNPEGIIIKSEFPTVEGISQQLFHVGRSEKMILLLAILTREAPESAIIFSNTKMGARGIAKRLKDNGYSCSVIDSDVPQRVRLRVISDMKSGRIKFLAATDIASRGIHIPNLCLVVNFDLPDDAENYIHRIGRTARGSQSTGKAISFACERFVYNLSSIEKLIKRKIPVAIVDEQLQKIVESLLEKGTHDTQAIEPNTSYTPRSHKNKKYVKHASNNKRPYASNKNREFSEEKSFNNAHKGGQKASYKKHDSPKNTKKSISTEEHFTDKKYSSRSTNSPRNTSNKKNFSNNKPPIITIKKESNHKITASNSDKKPLNYRPSSSAEKKTSNNKSHDKKGGILTFMSNLFKKEK